MYRVLRNVFLDCLTLQYGTDRLPKTSVNSYCIRRVTFQKSVILVWTLRGLYFLGTRDVPGVGGEWDGHPGGESPSDGKMNKNLDILHTKICK